MLNNGELYIIRSLFSNVKVFQLRFKPLTKCQLSLRSKLWANENSTARFLVEGKALDYKALPCVFILKV